MVSRPNILWICTDQQRWDSFDNKGLPTNTPNLERLQSWGTTFDNAYAQSPICTPSRVSMLTGRYPPAHTVHRNGNDFFPANETTVVRRFQEAGYHTALVGKHHLRRAHLRDDVKPEDGYDVVWNAQDPFPEPRAYGDWLRDRHGIDAYDLHKAVLSKTGLPYGEGVPTDLHPCTWWAETASEFVRKMPRHSPWFLSLHANDPHPPWFPPAEFLARYEDVTLDIPPPIFSESDREQFARLRGVDLQTKQICPPTRLANVQTKEIRHIEDSAPWDVPPDSYDYFAVRRHYCATIDLIDKKIGSVLDALEKSDQLENTLIVFTSDHGEMLGDHGLLYKGCRFYEQLVKVPLILAFPGRFEPRRSNALVELVDIAPTLLDLVGIDRPTNAHGASLLPILEGEANPNFHKPLVFSQFRDALPLNDASHGSMIFDGRYKCIVYHNHEGLGELYDLVEDPHEFNNLWDEPSAQAVKGMMLLRHLNFVAGSADSGPERSAYY